MSARMLAFALLAPVLLVRLSPVAWAQDAPDPTLAVPNHWFVPAGRNATGLDTTVRNAPEPVTVIGRRSDRSWRTKVASEHLNDPMASDAARPRNSFVAARPYCNSSLRTVGGQPATAGDMVAGMAAGRC